MSRYLTQPAACDRVQPTVPHTQCSVISVAMASLSESEEHGGESQRQPPFTPLAHVAFCNETPQSNWQLACMMSLPALRYRPPNTNRCWLSPLKPSWFLSPFTSSDKGSVLAGGRKHKAKYVCCFFLKSYSNFQAPQLESKKKRNLNCVKLGYG